MAHQQIAILQYEVAKLEAELAKEREKVKELAEDLSRVLETVKYLRGIAERGSGDRCPEDMTVEKFVLGYVQNLEARLKVASRRGKSVLPELAAAQATIEQMAAEKEQA